MAFCKQCGHEFRSETSKFCANCGAERKLPPAAAAPPPSEDTELLWRQEEPVPGEVRVLENPFALDWQEEEPPAPPEEKAKRRGRTSAGLGYKILCGIILVSASLAALCFLLLYRFSTPNFYLEKLKSAIEEGDKQAVSQMIQPVEGYTVTPEYLMTLGNQLIDPEVWPRFCREMRTQSGGRNGDHFTAFQLETEPVANAMGMDLSASYGLRILPITLWIETGSENVNVTMTPLAGKLNYHSQGYWLYEGMPGQYAIQGEMETEEGIATARVDTDLLLTTQEHEVALSFADAVVSAETPPEVPETSQEEESSQEESEEESEEEEDSALDIQPDMDLTDSGMTMQQVEVAQNLCIYYVTYLESINVQQPALLLNITDNYRPTAVDRVGEHLDYQFDFTSMIIDQDSMEFSSKGGQDRVELNVRFEYDYREGGGMWTPGSSTQHCQLVYNSANQRWEVDGSTVDNSITIGEQNIVMGKMEQ